MCLRLIWMTSLVITALKLAALSTKPSTSFSSVRTADARINGSRVKSLAKASIGMDVQALSPHRLRMSARSVPFPLDPTVE